jgi:hypothetical protein
MGKQRLGMLAHQPQVEAAKEIIATVTSTATKYRSGSRIEESGVEILEPGLGGTGEVVVRLAQRVMPHPGKESETA